MKGMGKREGLSWQLEERGPLINVLSCDCKDHASSC